MTTPPLPFSMEQCSTSSPPLPKSPKAPCSVCGEQGDGLHFGAEACRACAAFFRRSVALQKKYYCRNNGACETISNERVFCRLCRYAKCLQVGMKKTSVQQYRKTVGLSNEEDENSIPDMFGETSEMDMFNLNKLRECYRTMDEARNLIHQRGSTSVFEKKNPKYVNYRLASDINVKEFGALADFVMNAFPLLEQLEVDQQRVLFKHFYLPFTLLESGYFCSVLDRTNVILLGSGDYINLTNPEYFYGESPESSLMTGADAAKALAPSFEVFKRTILQPMLQHKVDEMEFMALCAFSMWDLGIEGQTPECEVLASKVRSRVTDELIYYYRNVLRIREPAQRLSALMILLPSLQRAVSRFRQDIEMSNFFNYDIDVEFYKIISGRY